ncbi:O-antigen ligase family protein [Capnocytophaga canis]|uniref:O-antigen ligase family protein n=1 Tax=Capnocytophaga canis TaxID=1848903 RepID=UPI0037D42CEF
MNIKKITSKVTSNNFALYTNVFLLLGAFIYYFIPSEFNLYASEKTLNIFFKIALVGIMLITFADIWLKRKVLFKNIDKIRVFFLLFASTIVMIYPYKHKMVLGLSIVLFSLMLLYGLYKRQYIGFHIIMKSLLIFILFVFASIFWATNTSEAFKHIDYFVLFLAVPLLSCFYRWKKEEIYIFIYPVFTAFLSLLSLNVIAYVCLVKYHQKPLFSFLSFSKSYLAPATNHYEILRWSETFHQSIIGWGLFIVGVLGYWLYKEKKQKLISIEHISLYAVLLACVSFMIQARVAMIGIVFFTGLFIWVELMKKINSRGPIFIYTAIITILGILSCYWIFTETPYFNDEIRHTMNNAAIQFFPQHFWIGGGANYEIEVIQSVNYEFNKLHNIFLSAMVNQGIIGLILLLLFHFYAIYTGIKYEHLLGIYVFLAFLIFNLTEDVLGYPICGLFFLFTLIPFEKEQINQIQK